MKTMFKHVFLLVLIGSFTNVQAQLTTQILEDRVNFQENGVVDALLRYSGTNLILDNNESGGDIFIQAAVDVDIEGIDDVIIEGRDDIFLATNNTTRLFINELGNIGIRTTTPDQELDINGDIALTDGTGLIEFKEGTTQKAFLSYSGSSLTLETDETGGDVILDALDDIFLQTGSPSGTRMFINQAGDIGIGTTGTAGKMNISYNSGVGIPHLMLSETSGSDFARITFRNTASSGSDYWDIAGKAAGSGNDPFFNLFYFNGSIGNNFFSIDRNNNNVEVDGDMIPFDVSFDIGNNNANEHWDDCVADDFINFSDKRLKQNIESLDAILPSLMQLKPVTYEYKPEHNPDGRKRTGFIAQEVQEVFPNVIVTEDFDRDAITEEPIRTQSDYLSMNYIELIPITIKALQEQQNMIESKDKQLEEQEARITELEAELSEIKAMLTQLADGGKVDISNQNATLTSATLEQNQPNPFTENTMIRYFIPETVKTASLRVTNLEGKQIKEIPIQHRGQGQVTLDANSLSAGTYQYTLILDGRILETKQMVLTRN